MKKRRVQPPDEVFSSKAEHTVKKLVYPRTTWDIPNALEAELCIPQSTAMGKWET